MNWLSKQIAKTLVFNSTPGTVPSDFDQDYLRSVVTRLSFPRPIGTPENEQARDLVANEFIDIFGMCQIQGETENLVVGDPSKADILVGAHYDSVPGTPGADDNASAVAVMLAVAKRCGFRGGKVAYVAFNSEEYGLAGSEEFVKSLTEHHLKEVHVLEMVGYRDRRPNTQTNPLPVIDCPTTGDFLGIITNLRSFTQRTVKKADTITVPVIGVTLPPVDLDTIRAYSNHVFRSDHANFWEAGIPAAMWTDTSEFRNRNYHQPTDTPDTLDYEFMAEIAKLLAECVNQ
jgi:Zn-dependent M28 family amino/carboxypeptidase